MIQTVLVTGVEGLLGSSVSSLLLGKGITVYGITRRNIRNINPSINYQFIDLASDWSYNDLPKRFDAVIHLAQSTNYRDFPNSALDVFKVNIESTARLLDYARQADVEKFIYASSGGVYGNSNHALKEHEPMITPHKLGYYLGSKASGEILVKSYAALFDVVVVRPFFIYGPKQKRGMLIPRLFDSVAKGKPITLQGNIGIRINPIHVYDAASAVIAALELNESTTLNIAGPDVLSIRDISEGIGRYLDVAPIFEQQPGEPSDLIADISAMKHKLAVPTRSLLDSLDDIDEV